MFNRRAQVAMEYVLIVTAVIAAILLALPLVKKRVGVIVDHSSGQAEKSVTDNFILTGGTGGGTNGSGTVTPQQ